MNRILNNAESKIYTDKGIDLKSNTAINYHFSVVVNAKRIELFNLTFNKFLNDGLLFFDGVSAKHPLVVDCNKGVSDDYYKIYRKGASNPFYIQKKNDIWIRTDEDVLFHSVLHKKISFDFVNCHPLVVIKVITDLKDVVDFIDKLYFYELDGSEVLRLKFPIGSVLMYQKRPIYGISTTNFNPPQPKQVIVVAYDYDRDSHEIKYSIHHDSEDEMSGISFNAFEDELFISRDINLDSLLDN